MKTIFRILCLSLFAVHGLVAQPVARFSIFFDDNSYVLTSESKKLLETELGKMVNIPEAYIIKLSGHTDSTGKFAYNMKLSEKRSRAVRDYLVQKTYPKKNIQYSYYGYTRPLGRNNDSVSRQKNRRVEIEISPKKIDVARSLGLKKEPTLFRINSDKEQTLTYQQSGSVLSVPADAFSYPDGKPFRGEVKLFYNEYRSRAEYILSNVPMQVDQHGEILPMVSGGMFDISATDMSGRPLAIRSGKEIRLQFVPANPLSNMFLWYRDTVTQSWQNLRSLQSYRPLFIANSFKSDTSIFPCKEVYFSEFQSRLSNLYWADKFYSNLGDTSTPPLKIFTQTNTSTSIKVDQFCKSIKKINQKTKFTIIPDKVEYITLNFMKSKSMNDLAKKGQYKIIYPNNPQLQSNLMGKIWEDYTLALNDSLLCFTLFEEGHIYQMVLSARYKGMMSSKNRIEKTAALLKSLTRKVNFNRTSQNKKYKEFLPIIKKDYPDSSWSDLFDRLAFAFSYNLAEKHHGEDTLSLESWLGFAFAHREYFNKRSISIRKNISVTAKDTRDIIMSNLEKIMLHPMNEAEFALHTDSLIRVYSELICLMNRYPSIPLNELKDTHLSHQNLKKLILKYETKPKIEQLLGIQVSEEFFFSHLDSFLIVYDMAISRRNAILANNPRGQQEERDALDYLKIQKFGIFNCDQISRLKSPKKLNAVYTTGKGELIDIVSIYLVDRLINSVLIFNGYNNLGPYNFSYSPSSNNSLLAFDADGKAWYCENDEFLKISGNKHTFVLKPVPKLKDRDALAEFIK